MANALVWITGDSIPDLISRVYEDHDVASKMIFLGFVAKRWL